MQYTNQKAQREASEVGAVVKEITLRAVDRAEWESAAPVFLDYNYRQTWAYGVALAARRRATSEHVLISKGTETVAAADVRIKRAPVGGLAYVSGGPLLRRGRSDDHEHLALALQTLQERYVNDQGLVLRVAPPIGDAQWRQIVAETLPHLGYLPSKLDSGYRTFLVDLEPPVEDLRRSLKQKWRNCLNSAERHDLSVIVGTSTAYAERFVKLFEEFVPRKGFKVDLDARFYASIQSDLRADDQLVFLFAERQGETHAGLLASMTGDTSVYLLGASHQRGLQSKAAYLLQWALMLLGKERGIRCYDLGGVDAQNNPGVFHFKQGVGGTEVLMPGPHEVRPAGLRGAASGLAEKIYRYIRGVRRLRGGGGV